MNSLQQAVNDEAEKQEEQKLAEKLFISMMGNSLYIERYVHKQIIQEAFLLAKKFKTECRDRYEN